jgi:hypothetical protein
MGRKRGGGAPAATTPAASAAPRAAPRTDSGKLPAPAASTSGTRVAHTALALCAAVAGALAFAPVLRHHAVYDDAFVLASRDLHTPAREWLADGCAPAPRGRRARTRAARAGVRRARRIVRGLVEGQPAAKIRGRTGG